jgi:predicted AAA+ superfamily ATPase
MEVLSLWPLSAAELNGDADFNRADWLFDGRFERLSIPPCDRDDLIARMTAGGFPEAVARQRPQRRSAWFSSYLDAILQRDVRDLARLEQLTEMPRTSKVYAISRKPSRTASSAASCSTAGESPSPLHGIL